VAAQVALWFALLGNKVITTAPTWTQIEMLLWPEIHRAYENSKYTLGGKLNKTIFNVRTEVWARGISNSDAVRFQGFHAAGKQSMLIILDEAPGIKPEIWEAIEGMAVGGDVRILALGNPVIGSGTFYNTFYKDSAAWVNFSIDAFDTPNFDDVRRIAQERGIDVEAALLTLSDEELNNNPRQYLTTKRAVKQRYLTWGPQSPVYQARIRGRFPLQADDALFALDWLEQSRTRELREPPLTVGWWAGVDVAGPGEDETVVTIRHGDVVREMHYFVDRDSRDKVWAVISPYVDYGIHINVDTIGQGYYFAAYLRDQLQARMATQCGVHDVDVGKSPLDKDLYANLKAEAYWKLRERFMEGRVSFNQQDVIGIDGWPIIAKPVEQLDKTIEQLAGIRYEQTDRNLIKIESKKHAKEERGVDSPDGAESLMLCFHDPLQHEIQDAGDVGQALADFTGLGMEEW
jgi:hypothetical protein